MAVMAAQGPETNLTLINLSCDIDAYRDALIIYFQIIHVVGPPWPHLWSDICKKILS